MNKQLFMNVRRESTTGSRTLERPQWNQRKLNILILQNSGIYRATWSFIDTKRKTQCTKVVCFATYDTSDKPQPQQGKNDQNLDLWPKSLYI